MTMLEYRARVEDANAEILHCEQTFLKDSGWVHSSAHPGSYWLWSKNYYHLPTTIALTIEMARQIEDLNYPEHSDDCKVFRTYQWADCNCSQKKRGANKNGD